MLPPELCSLPPFSCYQLVENNTVNLNLECIKNDLPKFRLHFNNDTRAWWENFLKNNGRTAKVNPKWILPLLAQQKETPNRQLKVNKRTNEVFQLIEREERDVEVIVFLLVLLGK